MASPWNLGSESEIRRNIGQNLRFFHIPCIRYGGARRNIATVFGVGNLVWCGYPTVTKSRGYVRPTQFETDGQTDARTTHDGISRAYT